MKNSLTAIEQKHKIPLYMNFHVKCRSDCFEEDEFLCVPYSTKLSHLSILTYDKKMLGIFNKLFRLHTFILKSVIAEVDLTRTFIASQSFVSHAKWNCFTSVRIWKELRPELISTSYQIILSKRLKLSCLAVMGVEYMGNIYIIFYEKIARDENWIKEM